MGRVSPRDLCHRSVLRRPTPGALVTLPYSPEEGLMQLRSRKSLVLVATAAALSVAACSEEPGLGASGTNQSGASFFNSFQWGIKIIQAPAAWAASPGGSGQRVCVLDTGVDPGHLDTNGKVDLAVSVNTNTSFAGNQTPWD